MARRKALGRGFESLLPPADNRNRVQEIPLDEIDPNPDQPRKLFSRESLEELARSVAKQGVLQPILVRAKGTRYELIVGERRWRASMQAKKETVPALVVDHPDDTRLELALVENLQRKDLGPLEIAFAYSLLVKRKKLTQEKVAELVGKKRSSVTNYLRLLDLPANVKEKLQNGLLSMGHARALSGLGEPELQSRLAAKIAREGLSVRQAEKLVQELGEAKAQPPSKGRQSSRVHFSAVEERLESALGTRAFIRGSYKRGKIIIEYSSKDEFESLLSRLERA